MATPDALAVGVEVRMECLDASCPIRHHHGPVTDVYPVLPNLAEVTFTDQDGDSHRVLNYRLEVVRQVAS